MDTIMYITKEGFLTMEKGKLGIRLSVYAVLAFILAAFGLYLGIIGLLAVVLIAEKDEWAGRQVLQALMLCLLPSMVSAVFGVLGFMNWFGWGSYGSAVYAISSIWSRFNSVINWLVNIAVYVFALIGILNVSKGKEAGIPVFSSFANWAYGKIVVKAQPVYQQPVYQQPVAPQAPVQVAAPAPQAPAQAANADVCANCGAPLNGGAFCTKCGTPAAK